MRHLDRPRDADRARPSAPSTCVIVPNDLQEADAVEDAAARARHACTRASATAPPPRVVPHERGPAPRRGRSSTPASASRCWSARARCTPADEVIEVAELLGAGVAKALLGKAALPDDLPWVTGSIGLLGTKPSWDLMTDCDTLLMVGSSFPYSEFLPEEGQARGVQIDIDGRMLGIRYPMEVNLVGDSARDAAGADPAAASARPTGPGSEKIDGEVGEWWKLIETTRAQRAPTRSTRSACSGSCRSGCPTRAILTSDSGSAANWFARDMRIREGMMASLSGTLATMGPGVPYAIAAKFALPRPAR